MRVALTAALPGLPGTDYELNLSDEAPGLYSLQSASKQGARLHLLDAGALHSYTPSLPSEDLAQLELTGSPLVLLIASIHSGILTLNLMAPIILNTVTGAGTQVILDGDYPLRAAFTDC